MLFRSVANREVVPVSVELKGRRVSVKVKLSRNSKGEMISIKPEYEDVRILSKKLNIPLRRLSEYVMVQAVQKLNLRNRYFHGKLLEAKDFQDEQSYKRKKS